ncbi:ULP-PROTEASE domain-containing protein [Aphelenchoides bicaudatus]|nr:ULP-PROTEASE domain-containing protein [Aphelenchoides bicaudatus]
MHSTRLFGCLLLFSKVFTLTFIFYFNLHPFHQMDIPIIRLLAKIEGTRDDTVKLGRVKTGKHSQDITVRDIRTMRFGEYLNDTIIDVYLRIIAKCHNKLPQVNKKVYIVNTFFYEAWAKKGYNGVKLWFRKDDIFEYDLVFFPINNESHWSIVVMDKGRRCFLYYDSLEFTDRKQEEDYATKYTGYVRQFVNKHAEEKHNEKDFCEGYICISQNSPKQLNSVDCGVFMLRFAKHYCQGDVKNKFKQEEMEDLRIQMSSEILCGCLFM